MNISYIINNNNRTEYHISNDSHKSSGIWCSFTLSNYYYNGGIILGTIHRTKHNIDIDDDNDYTSDMIIYSKIRSKTHIFRDEITYFTPIEEYVL